VAAAGDSLAGVHFYDGHVRDATAAARQARCAPLYSELLATLRKLPVDAAGLEIVTSGTPSFLQALAFPGFQGRNHRVSPGTVVYWDTTSAGFGIEGFQPAVHVLARVISASTSDCVTLDAGSKAIDAAAGDPCADVVGWPGLVAQTPSEEHLPLLVRHGEPPKPGMLLQLVPRHVCPTVNLADEAVLLEGDSILRIVPVAARGHETAPTGWR
jgi:D-serine deaminase-like pyridoxal phosphate-dependent protein